jgi:VanZ family protein
MAVIFYLSDQPNLVPTHGFFQTLVRKVFHVAEYTALALAWWRAIHGLVPRAGKWIELAGTLAITLAFAISDEWHQSFVTGRQGSGRDVAIDAIGIAIAAAIVLSLYARRRIVGPSRPSAA